MERNKNLTPLSQSLRRNQTKEEALLWNCFLKKYPFQFRRQYVIGNYITDFYCHRARLVVELDGSGHYEPEKMQKDKERTNYLESHGIGVLRFSNLEVTRYFNAVCEKIELEIKQRTKEER